MELIPNHVIFPGKIVTIETVSVPIINGNVDATGTRWIESANDDAPYAFILRLYTVQDSSAKETLGECVVHVLLTLFYDDYFIVQNRVPSSNLYQCDITNKQFKSIVDIFL